jgi:hypothetical protein
MMDRVTEGWAEASGAALPLVPAPVLLLTSPLPACGALGAAAPSVAVLVLSLLAPQPDSSTAAVRIAPAAAAVNRVFVIATPPGSSHTDEYRLS